MIKGQEILRAHDDRTRNLVVALVAGTVHYIKLKIGGIPIKYMVSVRPGFEDIRGEKEIAGTLHPFFRIFDTSVNRWEKITGKRIVTRIFNINVFLTAGGVISQVGIAVGKTEHH